jgi:crotonobetainyl-CoA:carnitine CoA-transferase CaiB-like acyl-CoA transferase
MAASLPGALLRDLGAEVARVQSSERMTLDAGVEWARAWNRGKEIVEVNEEAAGETVAALAGEADVVFLAGPESAIEGWGLGAHQLGRANPRLVGVRIRPSFNAFGSLPDLELLVAARAGLTTQINSHVPGRPAFPELSVGQAGAALSATVGALAGLYERESSGAGRWAETSIYDGLQAILPMVIGRVEHHSPSTRLLWQEQGVKESLCYRCADGEYVQLWFGAKGAYDEFLEHMGDPPSEKGYNADLISGALVERGERWSARFATHDRPWWLENLAGRNFRCEPALRPGEAFTDPHVREVGLATDFDDPEGGRLTALGPVVEVTPRGQAGQKPHPAAGPLLTGVRVLDLSAYLAGPVMPLVLAELGADVIKVEPVTGDVHRNMEPMFAAGQRGKRALALDLKAPASREVLSRLFRWSDVVHHNSRIGLADRLGYDEDTVRAANPDVVYSFASGFGERGPKAKLPSNDQLMQAVAGIERAQGGADAPPTFLVWGAVDVTGGWIAACGVLAGLYARRRSGAGQRVASSLLGAGLTLKSGAWLKDGAVTGSPLVDSDQMGYGAAYRLYQGSDGEWFALAVTDRQVWDRLRRVVGADELPHTPPPLRTDGGDPQPEEQLLEKHFGRKDAAAWLSELGAAGVPVAPVCQVDREGFVAGFLDDPLNRQLGRVLEFHWGVRGRVAQCRFPPRFGPDPAPGAPASIAGLGQHTPEVLGMLGFDRDAQAALAASGAIPPS